MSQISPGTERAIRELPQTIRRLTMAIERLEETLREETLREDALREETLREETSSDDD
jgi:hypothetical protein